ncbi:MAG: DoxX family protein [Solirubrobacteraceae bacterium]
MKLGRLFLRAVIGGVFVSHGAQKLFGWFGGHGLEATSQGFESMGMRPGRVHATAASVTEIASGTLELLGLATPLAASGITGVMLTAINRVHKKNGFFNTDGGYEFNLVLIGAALALAEAGPGAPSLDSALGIDMYGPGWALAALAAGAAGAAGAHLYAESQAEPPAPTPPSAAEQTVSEQAPAEAAHPRA